MFMFDIDLTFSTRIHTDKMSLITVNHTEQTLQTKHIFKLANNSALFASNFLRHTFLSMVHFRRPQF